MTPCITRSMAAASHKLPYLLSVLALLLSGASCISAWRTGRATFYGNEPWYWSIHHGRCGNGYIWPDQGTGWDVAALADAHPEYRGSCGVCYEVKCDSKGVRDGYGEYMDRSGACKDTEASVVVRTTDTCPCSYPNNYYSNKRWCCGDMDHFDVSVWAFQKLTDMTWGVIPIQYRRVDCGHQPAKRAYGASFPGEFPPVSQASSRSDFDYYRYFPNGGYLNSKAGDGSKLVSTDEYLRMVGRGGSSYSSSSSSSSSSGSSSPSSGSSSSPSGGSSSNSGSSGGWFGRRNYGWGGGNFFGFFG